LEHQVHRKESSLRLKSLMADKPRLSPRIIVPLAAVGFLAIFLFVWYRPVTLHGAVVRAGDDPNKQVPIANAEIVASDGFTQVATKSGVSGGFQLTVRRALIRRHSLVLSFQHPGYQPYEIVNPEGNQLYVARMTELPGRPVTAGALTVHVGNISVRYTVKTPSTVDIGSGVKTFEVDNKPNVPCRGDVPCSPDGKWKAATAIATLDAGPDNEFRNGRVSCIAGPCPFTAIAHDGFSHGGRTISVTVLDWSATTTFLLQAEAVRRFVSETVRKSYPVIFDRTMNFSLPESAQGTCIEADVEGTPIVFPIGPSLSLSWADCETETEAENTKLYRCELKPGYMFR
jgi:hypothetical protein